MNRRTFLLTWVLVLAPVGCAKPKALMPFTAHHVDQPVAFESNGERFEAPAGSFIVDGGFAEYLSDILVQLRKWQMRAMLAERQVEMWQRKQWEDNQVGG